MLSTYCKASKSPAECLHWQCIHRVLNCTVVSFCWTLDWAFTYMLSLDCGTGVYNIIFCVSINIMVRPEDYCMITVCHVVVLKSHLIGLLPTVRHLLNGHHLIGAHIPCLRNTQTALLVRTSAMMYISSYSHLHPLISQRCHTSIFASDQACYLLHKKVKVALLYKFNFWQ